VEKKVICSRIINTVWKGRSKNMFLSDGMMVRQRYGPINLGLFNDYNLFIHTPPPFSNPIQSIQSLSLTCDKSVVFSDLLH